MCGILGFNWNDRERLEELSKLLVHRGPDQDGYYNDELISLGHRRLSIIDLSEKGREPMGNEDDTVFLTFNGEIYNFHNLREELERKGHTFRSDTDAEVIIHGYEESGARILHDLNGQFAFGIYDKNAGRLLLARDRFGIKPLYYYDKDGQFIFGSELKVLIKSDIEKEIDREALNHYLVFGYTPSEKSIIKDVLKLLPGHYIVYDLNTKRIVEHERYWEIDFKKKKLEDEEQVRKQLYSKLEESVKRRLVADVPVGAFLSGGVDSSIIVALMSKHVGDLKTFSIRFDYEDFNESEYARIISEKFKTDHYEIEFNAENVKGLIPKLVYSYDDPFGDPSMIPTYLVSKVAREKVTVCLSGTGGDELFAGYPRIWELMTLKRLNKLPRFVKRILVKGYSLVYVDRGKKLGQLFKEESSDEMLYLKLFSYLFRDEKELEIDMDGLSYLGKYFMYDDDLSNLLNFEQNEYLPNNSLQKEDRAALGVSLEGRVPFLDHEFSEYVNSIDSNIILKKGEGKYILKKTFEDTIPHKILYRKKQGFGVPLVHYFRNELKDYAFTILFDFDKFDYYDKQTLREMWEKHQRGESDYSHIFWTIMMFNLWYDMWMK